MALRLPVYGARRCLRDGVIAAHEGRIEDALACMRGYFALRADAMRRRITQADAEAVMLAATCAAIRTDPIEVDAVDVLLGEHRDPWVEQARAWIATARCAVRGELPEVVDALKAEVPAVVKALGPAVLLVAAERDVDHIDEDAEDLFRATFGGDMPAMLQARVLMIQARASLVRDDRAAAIAHLERIPVDASAFHAFIAALTSGRGELQKRWQVLAESERAAAAGFATSFAVGASSGVARLLLEVCVEAPAAVRSALLAALATALVRERKPREALDELGTDDDSAVVRLARAHALIALGRSAEALRGLAEAPADPDERDVALVAAASAADDGRLRALLELDLAAPPSRDARNAAIAYLATVRDLPARMPAWLEARPDEPDALYAWAILQTRRERGAVALAAFEHAIALDASLADASDGPDVARVIAAREALRDGDLAAAESLLGAVRSPRMGATALVLLAMVLVRRTAASEHVKLDENALGQTVRELLVALPPGQREHRAVGMLAKSTDDLRARWLLRQGRVDEARPVVARFANDTTQSAFFAAILAILDGRSLDDCERELVRASAMPGSDKLLGVLLAEVRGARGDAHARVAALEAIRRSDAGTVDTLVDEALVAAYGGARRGLDAKRVALEELRRTKGTLGAVLAAQLQDALGFEAPPASKRAPGAESARSGLRADTLGDRAKLLVQFAKDRAAREPARRPAIDDAARKFTRAMLDRDLAAAALAERELLRACTGGAP